MKTKISVLFFAREGEQGSRLSDGSTGCGRVLGDDLVHRVHFRETWNTKEERI